MDHRETKSALEWLIDNDGDCCGYTGDVPRYPICRECPLEHLCKEDLGKEGDRMTVARAKEMLAELEMGEALDGHSKMVRPVHAEEEAVGTGGRQNHRDRQE